ncbi:hypothetical protein Cgig2_018758 [Carnegiea gigantea]|uniref:Aminotransferase-like plant mobile domain-containing protein n=1 Tax=Carnegiea gigantea TaxID=171969 RepID=A0A9Q1GT88_9CARY|nr:hypothetical protein Cgig2_018758 [Carnegiea gigantea]
MADLDERMQAEDATNSKNSMNDNMTRKFGVILTYKRKSSLQPTLKRAPKRTPKKKIQFRHVNVEELVSESTDLTLITTRSWSGLLRHRIALGGFLRLVERLEYEQWSAIVEAGFGGILSVRTKLIPKKLSRWLLEKYDPWDNSLNLANGKLLIDEEDVYATLGLPMGEFEVIEGQTSDVDIEFSDLWRRRWNIERGAPPIGSVDEVILARAGHGHEFIINFITYAISSCIIGNANGTCHFRVVKYLRNIDEIKRYNWCAYAIKCLNDAVVEWKKDKSKFFTRSLLFLMLFYMDRVQFRGRKVERSFPVAINWDTDKVRNRDKDEQLSGGYGKGRIIERIDYQIITRLAKVDLDINMQEMERGQPHKGGTSEMSQARPSKEQRCPFFPHCNGQCEDLIHVNDDPIQDNVTKGAPAQQGETSTEMQAQNLEFLEQLDKLESVARGEIQHRKRVACSPSSFSLGMSLEQEAIPAPSAHPTPSTVQVQWGEKIAEPSTTSTEQQTDEGSEHVVNPEKAPQTSKGTDKATEIHEINKAKQVVKRQPSKRMMAIENETLDLSNIFKAFTEDLTKSPIKDANKWNVAVS